MKILIKKIKINKNLKNVILKKTKYQSSKKEKERT